MNEQQLHAKLLASGLPGIGELDTSARDPFVRVDAGSIVAVLTFLRDDHDCRMEMLHNLTAVERPDAIELVYHVCSLARHHALTVKLSCPRPDGGNHDTWIPEVPSVAGVYSAANWHEREQWDLLGVRFAGHPDHRRILLPEEWIGHPLRKDYVYPTWHDGIPLELDAIPLYEPGGGQAAAEAAAASAAGAAGAAAKAPRKAGEPLFQPPAPLSTRPLAPGGKTTDTPASELGSH